MRGPQGDLVPRTQREAAPAARSAPPAVLTLAEERRNLLVLWVGCYLTSASWSLVLPFLPILLRHLGVPEARLSTWTGLAFSITFLTAMVAAPIWGAWADAAGRKVNCLRSGVTITVVMIGLANAGSPGMVLIWRLLNGAFSGFIPAAFSLVAATVPSERLGRAMGFLQSGPAAGTITGPLIGGALVQLWGIHWTFYLAAASQVVATLLVLLFVREPVPPRKGMRLDVVGGLLEAWRFSGLQKILGLTMLVQLGTTLIEPLITLYVGEFRGVTAVPFLAGLLFSLLGIASVICSPWWGRRGERRGYGPIVLWGLAGAGVGNALQLVVGSLWSFGAVRFLTGIAYAGANTGLGTLAATAVPEEFRGRAYGLLTAWQQMGNLIGPLGGGIWAGFYGIHSAFGLAALVFGVALLLAAVWTRRGVAWADVSIR